MTHQEKIRFIEQHGARHDFPVGGHRIASDDKGCLSRAAIYGARWESRIIAHAESVVLSEFLADFHRQCCFYDFSTMFDEGAAQRYMDAGPYVGLEIPSEPKRALRFHIHAINLRQQHMIMRGYYLEDLTNREKELLPGHNHEALTSLP